MTADTPAPDLVLAGEFPTPNRADWQRLVAKVLRSDDPEAATASLVTRTLDDIDIEPLYLAADTDPDTGYPGLPPFIRGGSESGVRGGWDVRQWHAHPEPAVAHDNVMTDLQGGVTSLWLGLGEGMIPVDSLAVVLSQVHLDLAAVALDPGRDFAAAATSFLGLVAELDVASTAVRANLGADPLGLEARTGEPGDLDAAVDLARQCADQFSQVRALVVDALPYHESGATDAEEIGCTLAAGVAYLRALNAAGLSAEDAFGQLEFRYGATADQFATIAKFRAARRLWSRIADECGVTSPAGGQRQHGVSSRTMLTVRDPWNNILRGTIACFAAGVGGADAVTVLPLDEPIGHSDRLSHRIARNTHAVLVEESHVAAVIDPAGGSWYVESLTDQLADRGWQWFREIERAGGLRDALRSGLVAQRVGRSRAARIDRLARGDEVITGVSVFPLFGEKLLERPPRESHEPDDTGLPRVRWAQWHEAYRLAADEHTARTGSAPTVSLVRLGAPAASAARARDLTALLASGGVASAGAEASDLTGLQPVTLVISDDDTGPEELHDVLARIRSVGVTTVIVAAQTDPGSLTADLVVTGQADAFAILDVVFTGLRTAS